MPARTCHPVNPGSPSIAYARTGHESRPMIGSGAYDMKKTSLSSLSRFFSTSRKVMF